MKSNERDEKAKEILKLQPAIGRTEMGRLLGISENSARPLSTVKSVRPSRRENSTATSRA